jgi:hypothetical protein
MKNIVSVSIGSSKRDHTVEIEIFGEKIKLQRIGTDGDIKKAQDLIKELDGKVDAIGLGGIDLYLWAGGRRYVIKDALKLKNAAKITPVVDGSGLKNTLERDVIRYLERETEIIKPSRKVLLVSAVDRFGMAEALIEAKCDVIFGDFIFSLHLPIPLRSLSSVDILARVLLPVLTRLPFQILYPTGEKQEKIQPKYSKYYEWAEIIAGDFHFIKRYMPENVKGKIIITNTTTSEDVEFLRKKGISILVTTTPELEGRSFGTNVMEAMLVALIGKKPEEIKPEEYLEVLKKIGMRVRIEKLVSI